MYSNYATPQKPKTAPSRKVEITILSGEDLRIDRKSVKKNAFVIVRVDPFNFRTTNIDTLGGSYPTWNEKLDIDLPDNSRYITLEVHCKSNSSGKRNIGTVNVPVSDFIGGYLPENYLHFLSYRLRDSSGEKNGIINISVRVNVPDYATCSSQAGVLNVQGYGTCTMLRRPERMGIPVGDVATGIPVWGLNRA